MRVFIFLIYSEFYLLLSPSFINYSFTFLLSSLPHSFLVYSFFSSLLIPRFCILFSLIHSPFIASLQYSSLSCIFPVFFILFHLIYIFLNYASFISSTIFHFCHSSASTPSLLFLHHSFVFSFSIITPSQLPPGYHFSIITPSPFFLHYFFRQ